MHASSAWFGFLLGASALVSQVARAESTPNASEVKPGTRETLELAARAEFQASAQSLRERLARAEEGDAVGVAVADQALTQHRARYLDVKRALARLLPRLPSAAAERNPFEPDFFQSNDTLVKTAFAVRNAWDLYRPMAPAERLSTAGHPVASPGPSTTASWGMYGPLVGAHPNAVSAPDVSGGGNETPAQPFLVYRALGSQDPRQASIRMFQLF